MGRSPRFWGRVRAGAWALGLGLAAGLAGCSAGDGGRPEVHPVTGRVEVDGEPAAGAFVVFHPAEGAGAPADAPGADPVRPSAQVGPDGSFALSTYDERDGAPAGSYAVTVEWRKVVVARGGDAQAGPNVLPARYARAESTPLKIAVRPGANDLGALPIRK